jgi:hypothetical protein
MTAGIAVEAVVDAGARSAARTMIQTCFVQLELGVNVIKSLRPANHDNTIPKKIIRKSFVAVAVQGL